MDKAMYRVVLTGELVSGFSREAVIAALARLFETSAGNLAQVLDRGECPIDEIMTAADAAVLQERLEMVGARARVDRASDDHDLAVRLTPGLTLPRHEDPAEVGLMNCPACGHRQLVAPRCDECGVVFADFNRQRLGGSTLPKNPLPRQPQARPQVRPGNARPVAAPRGRPAPRDIHAVANAQWRDDWLDDEDPVPTEQYHVGLFMGPGSAALADGCSRLILGRRTRFKLGWISGAVVSPFLWAMYRKMWAWGMVIFAAEILLPVMLITLGTEDGMSPKYLYLGLFLLAANRVFWPAVLPNLYCRHARRMIMYLHRLSPTYAADIDIATRGGTSRTSVLVGVVIALVVSLLAWNIVDSVHARFAGTRAVFTAPPTLPGPAQTPASAEQAATSTQDELLVNENKWVATRNKLRVLGQRVNAWLVSSGTAIDAARLDIGRIAQALNLDADATLDGWGRPVSYQSDGAGFHLVSAGPDGTFGTPDDVEYRRILER